MIILVSPRFIKTITRNFASAITLFPFIILDHSDLKKDDVLINHERIHIRQQMELLLVFFYILYFLEYALNRFKGYTHSMSYHNISFEKEAYANENNPNYLKKRSIWAWTRYI